MDSCPLVCIIIVNYNGRKHLEYCLPTVCKTDYPNYQIIVVDNASIDDSIQWLKKFCPEITVLKSKKNRGWAGGNNLGIREAISQKAKYIVLLNNDTKVDKRWVREAVKVVESNSRVGLLGFKVFGEYVKESEGEFEKAQAAWNGIKIERCNHIAGCALFLRTEIFNKIGLFDETYFAYGEEDDFESRAIRAGKKLFKINVPIWHYLAGSFESDKLFASCLTMRNGIRYYIKNENFKNCLLEFLRITNTACNPAKKINPDFFYHRRLRPSNIFINFLFLLYAFFWNLINLPQTIWSRIRDNAKILFPDAEGKSGLRRYLYHILPDWLKKKVSYIYRQYYLRAQKKKGIVKINLGCGDWIRFDYINIDKYNRKADLRTDARSLKMFKDNSVDEIFSSHLIEHLPRKDLKNTLQEWYRILKPRGKLEIWCPNFERYLKEWLAGDNNFRQGEGVAKIFGHDEEGMVHRNGFTCEILREILESVGFIILRNEVIDTHMFKPGDEEYRENGDLECIATKR